MGGDSESVASSVVDGRVVGFVVVGGWVVGGSVVVVVGLGVVVVMVVFEVAVVLDVEFCEVSVEAYVVVNVESASGVVSKWSS